MKEIVDKAVHPIDIGAVVLDLLINISRDEWF